MSLHERFWAKVRVAPANMCWEWLGAKSRGGYGEIWVRNENRPESKVARAHRLSWEFRNGKIPNDLLVCHHCDNPSCVNPDHLFVGTIADNMADKKKKGREAPQKGEQNHNSRLSSEQVAAILSSDQSQRKLASIYGVGKTAIANIKARRRWAHLE